MNIGTVIKGIGGVYTVLCNDEQYQCTARKKLKQDNKIIIGDLVEFQEHQKNEYVIEKIKERKNKLIRPEVSNIDTIVMILSPKPKPDFLMLDKMLVYAFINDIEFILVVNKIDIATKEFINKINSEYSFLENILLVSAIENKNINHLFDKIKQKKVVLSGQSAVGKSTILNNLDPNLKLKVGPLSEKIQRGKNTTRKIEFFRLKNKTLIADTPGFSLLNLNLDKPELLKNYYPDFNKYSKNCKLRNCNHIYEKECGIINAVENKKIKKERYDRYRKLYLELKSVWEKKYD
ncbi:MAG: ribosome small subunit-dependent GTPase A [Candidatus Woesearchaeota archaeon]